MQHVSLGFAAKRKEDAGEEETIGLESMEGDEDGQSEEESDE